jgi:hypothetical protein
MVHWGSHAVLLRYDHAAAADTHWSSSSRQGLQQATQLEQLRQQHAGVQLNVFNRCSRLD